MNDEDARILRKRGPKKGSAHEVESLIWQSLLGDFAEELIQEAHEDIEQERGK